MPAARILVLLAAAAYVAALFLPCVSFANGMTGSGLWALLIGWIGATVGTFAWFANLTAITAGILVAASKPILAAAVAISSIGLGLQALALRSIPSDGPNIVIDHWMIGYYVWILSFVLLLLASIARWVGMRREKHG